MGWLETALDCGINEFDFWDMTLGEIARKIESYRRVQELEDQRKAVMDYIQADLIGISIGRLYSSNNQYPPIEKVYPTLFESQELDDARQQKQDELSALRFKLFANSFNTNYSKESD